MSEFYSDLPVTYREYTFPSKFPLLFMQGTQISDRVDFIHFHNCIEIAICKKGLMYWNLENDIHEISQGSFLFLPPFFTHASYFPPQAVEDVCCQYLFFNPEELLAPFYPNGLPVEFSWYWYMEFNKIFSAELFPEETELLDLIVEEMDGDKEYSSQVVSGLIEALMVRLYRRQEGKLSGLHQSNLRAQLFPAIAYMDKEYMKDQEPDFLAHLCGLSRAQFLECFRRGFQQTPRQYLQVVRIRKACCKLTRTEESILSIALESGFHSLSSFNRTFRKITGRSPQTFRNEKRGIRKNVPRYAPYQAEGKS